MFLVDISSSMGDTRIVELPPGPNGEERTREMTNLEWSLQFVKLKIQEMVIPLTVHSDSPYSSCLFRYTMDEKQISVGSSYLVLKVRQPCAFVLVCVSLQRDHRNEQRHQWDKWRVRERPGVYKNRPTQRGHSGPNRCSWAIECDWGSYVYLSVMFLSYPLIVKHLATQQSTR